MEQEITFLKKQVRQLQIMIFSGLGLFVLFIFFSFTQEENFEIIRAKGIVIEDGEGRDRILIGAPIPFSNDRVRTDTALVRKYWSGNYDSPDRYMKWYQDYSHSAIGMVVMNEQGFDRVQVGDKLADPNIGKRTVEASGIMWNDREGYEKGGAGVNTLKDGLSRSVVGLDNDQGEAIHLVALEDGSTGLMLGGNNGYLRIGMAEKEGEFFQNKDAFTGIKYFDQKGNLLWEQEMKKE